MPLAVPVEVLDVEEGPAVGAPNAQAIGGKQAGITTSQDFLAQLGIAEGKVLGVDRADPRMGGKGHGDMSGDGEQSSAAFLMPQLGAHYAQPQMDASAQPVAGDVQVSVTSAGRPMLTSPVMLANEIAGLAANGGGAIKMRVMPEGLGELTINVKTEGSKLNVHFEASNAQARDALVNSMPELRQMLSASRYDVGALEVERSNGSSLVSMSRGSDGSMNFGSFNQSQNSQYSEWHGSGNGSQNGSAWDRYLDQQERQFQQQQNRGGYRRYQESQGAYA